MNKNERIFTKKDIIIFFIISMFCSFFCLVVLSNILSANILDVVDLLPGMLIFYIPTVLAVILNLIFKLTNIENEKIIKITKIIFYPIIFLLMFLEGALTILWVL